MTGAVALHAFAGYGIVLEYMIVDKQTLAAIAHGSRVIHISSHRFTPELNGEIRQADSGCCMTRRD